LQLRRLQQFRPERVGFRLVGILVVGVLLLGFFGVERLVLGVRGFKLVVGGFVGIERVVLGFRRFAFIVVHIGRQLHIVVGQLHVVRGGWVCQHLQHRCGLHRYLHAASAGIELLLRCEYQPLLPVADVDLPGVDVDEQLELRLRPVI
jgi:hypothetical protein